jgi:hypothetical protein
VENIVARSAQDNQIIFVFIPNVPVGSMMHVEMVRAITNQATMTGPS